LSIITHRPSSLNINFAFTVLATLKNSVSILSTFHSVNKQPFLDHKLNLLHNFANLLLNNLLEENEQLKYSINPDE
jgi:hypothetical protein